MQSTAFLVLAIIAIALEALTILLALFEPDLEYAIPQTPPPPDSAESLRLLSLICDAQPYADTSVEVLANGERFYEEELEAIAQARHHVHLEAYIFQKSKIGERFVAALAERARAGVQVKVILDAVGSFSTTRHYFQQVREAGGRMEWYQPLRWYTFGRWNHRSHRELLVVDGRVGFVGGAGIADNWYTGRGRNARWRDTVYRIRGGVVASMQAVFAEHWLEAAGEMLVGPEYFPRAEPAPSGIPAMAIGSAPAVNRSTRARMLYQLLLASARRSIYIVTPYFLPDRRARQEIASAVRRGVEVHILVPGVRSDHVLTRRTSRRLYGRLLEAGARIYEYQPAMLHAKTLVVDGVWSVIGSTNFDRRSFGLNDEVNLAAQNHQLAARILEDFQRDLAQSREVGLEEWKRRMPWERVHEWFGGLLERQE